MAGKTRKLPLLAAAFMVVSLVAAGFLQLYVITPQVVLASPDTAGPNTAGTASGTNWLNPGYTAASDDSHATYDNNQQDDLRLTNFGFSIPAGSTIDGIVVTREGYGDGPTEAKRQFRIGLTKDGSTLAGTRKIDQPLPITEDTVDIGNATDLWGTTWTVAEINATTFGVLISDNDAKADEIGFDYIEVTIHYTPGVIEKSVTQGITLSGGVTKGEVLTLTRFRASDRGSGTEGFRHATA